MFQLQMNFSDDVELNPNIVRLGDPGWEQALKEWESAPAFGFDCETYGFGDGKNSEAVDWKKAYIRLTQIGLMSGKCLIADFGGWEEDQKKYFEDHAEFIRILRKKGPDTACVKIGHNLTFDMLLALRFFHTEFRNIRDTMLISQVYWAGVKTYRHTLEDVADRLGYKVDKTEQKSSWGQELTNSQLNYAAEDTQIVLRIAADLKKMCVEANIWHTAMIENNACPAFVEMMYRGLPVDVQILNELHVEYTKAEADARRVFELEFPGVSATSPAQVKRAVEARYNIKLEGVNKKELAYLNEPWVASYLLASGLRTQIGYLVRIKKELFNGRVHPKFFQIAGPDREKNQSDEEGKGMGRSSCKAPNLQNPSTPTKKWLELGLRSVREMFRAPEGYKFIINDLSQAHMRIAAEASQDPVLVEAYNSKTCLHSLTASQLAIIQGLDGTEWTASKIKAWDKDDNHPNHAKAKALRKVGKTQNYAALNGAGPEKIMATAASNSRDPVFAPLEDWVAVGQAFKELYSGLEQYRRQKYNEASDREMVFDGRKYAWIYGHSGRRIFLEKVPSRRYESGGSWVERLAPKYTDACSAIWLSTEADAAKISLAEWQERRDKEGWDAYLVNFPHDEINVIAHESCALEAATALLEIMDNSMRRFIKSIPVNDPLDPQTLICDSWAEK